MKLNPPDPPSPAGGGERSALEFESERKDKKQPGKPNARLVKVDTKRTKDKAKLRQRIPEAQNRRKKRVIQGTVVPPRGADHSQRIGQLPGKYRGLVAD